ncbi:hypothetical protein GN958_ATG17001 [Phytophthora infestans]|uniref:SET domain-containing protein n=1 Tax=Phytophthora infestans TaxID=4787 RepID=A0A8S9U463_PHYIN|nr:hypothetical protein GN958_ATG17001 [Phytophthora infestans]
MCCIRRDKWGSREIIVIDSSSNSDEEVKPDWPTGSQSEPRNRVALSAPTIVPTSRLDISVSLRGAAIRPPVPGALERNSTTRRSRTGTLQGAVSDHGNSPQRKQPPSGLYARPKKNLPPSHRPNYVVHEVRVKRAPPKVSSKPESLPSATETIRTSPMSMFAGTIAPCPDIDYASTSGVAFLASPWPPRIVYLHEYYNPASIRLPFVFNYGDCGCSDPCRIDTCRNANMNVVCTDKCCVWEELCANRLYALVANVALERGEVLGEYLGRLRYV